MNHQQYPPPPQFHHSAMIYGGGPPPPPVNISMRPPPPPLLPAAINANANLVSNNSALSLFDQHLQQQHQRQQQSQQWQQQMHQFPPLNHQQQQHQFADDKSVPAVVVDQQQQQYQQYHHQQHLSAGNTMAHQYPHSLAHQQQHQQGQLRPVAAYIEQLHPAGAEQLRHVVEQLRSRVVEPQPPHLNTTHHPTAPGIADEGHQLGRHEPPLLLGTSSTVHFQQQQQHAHQQQFPPQPAEQQQAVMMTRQQPVAAAAAKVFQQKQQPQQLAPIGLLKEEKPAGLGDFQTPDNRTKTNEIWRWLRHRPSSPVMMTMTPLVTPQNRHSRRHHCPHHRHRHHEQQKHQRRRRRPRSDGHRSHGRSKGSAASRSCSSSSSRSASSSSRWRRPSPLPPIPAVAGVDSAISAANRAHAQQKSVSEYCSNSHCHMARQMLKMKQFDLNLRNKQLEDARENLKNLRLQMAALRKKEEEWANDTREQQKKEQEKDDAVKKINALMQEQAKLFMEQLQAKDKQIERLEKEKQAAVEKLEFEVAAKGQEQIASQKRLEEVGNENQKRKTLLGKAVVKIRSLDAQLKEQQKQLNEQQQQSSSTTASIEQLREKQTHIDELEQAQSRTLAQVETLQRELADARESGPLAIAAEANKQQLEGNEKQIEQLQNERELANAQAVAQRNAKEAIEASFAEYRQRTSALMADMQAQLQAERENFQRAERIRNAVQALHQEAEPLIGNTNNPVSTSRRDNGISPVSSNLISNLGTNTSNNGAHFSCGPAVEHANRNDTATTTTPLDYDVDRPCCSSSLKMQPLRALQPQAADASNNNNNGMKESVGNAAGKEEDIIFVDEIFHDQKPFSKCPLKKEMPSSPRIVAAVVDNNNPATITAVVTIVEEEEALARWNAPHCLLKPVKKEEPGDEVEEQDQQQMPTTSSNKAAAATATHQKKQLENNGNNKNGNNGRKDNNGERENRPMTPPHPKRKRPSK